MGVFAYVYVYVHVHIIANFKDLHFYLMNVTKTENSMIETSFQCPKFVIDLHNNLAGLLIVESIRVFIEKETD